MFNKVNWEWVKDDYIATFPLFFETLKFLNELHLDSGEQKAQGLWAWREDGMT